MRTRIASVLVLAIVAAFLLGQTTAWTVGKVAGLKVTKCKTIETPISNEDWVSIWRSPVAVTITGLWCEAASATSVAAMLHVDTSGQSAIVDDNPVNTGGDMSCVTGGDTEAAPDGDVTVAVGETLDLDSNTVSGDVSAYTFCWDYTYD